MTRKNDLSATMAVALAEAIDHGSELIRLAGGFWTYPDCPRRAHDGIPTWYVGASTVQALVTRLAMEYTEFKQGRGFNFPIRVRVRDEYLAPDNTAGPDPRICPQGG